MKKYLIYIYLITIVILPFLTTTSGQEIRSFALTLGLGSLIFTVVILWKYWANKAQLYKIAVIMLPIYIAMMLLSSQNSLWSPPTDGPVNSTLGIEVLLTKITNHSFHSNPDSFIQIIASFCSWILTLFILMNIAWIIKKSPRT
jgi:hypothetical protein